MAGRKPTPTALKVARGNPGKRALNQVEPKPQKMQPKMPAHLTPAAKAQWRRVLRILSPMRILTEVEADLLAIYADAYARWVEEHRAVYGPRVDDKGQPLLDSEGLPLQPEGTIVLSAKGNLMRNPRLKIIEDTLTRMQRCQAELGMTPSARTRLVAPSGELQPMQQLREVARLRMLEYTKMEMVGNEDGIDADGRTIDAE